MARPLLGLLLLRSPVSIIATPAQTPLYSPSLNHPPLLPSAYASTSIHRLSPSLRIPLSRPRLPSLRRHQVAPAPARDCALNAQPAILDPATLTRSQAVDAVHDGRDGRAGEGGGVESKADKVG